ncbi:hypothetical protein Tco_1391991, partial [Tanacetum coccineum]
SGPDWLFDIDALTRTINYKPFVAGTQSNGFAGTKASDNSNQDDGSKSSSDDEKKVDEDPRKDSESIDQEKDDNVNSTNNVNAANTNKANVIDVGAKADMNNLDTTIQSVLFQLHEFIKNITLDQVIRDFNQQHKSRIESKNLEEHGIGSVSTPGWAHGIYLLAWMGWDADIEGRGLGKMIGSLMYLTSSRPDMMCAVCACARYQVNPKVSHLYAVKRIFRYLKGQPKLGLWYPKDSPFDLVAYIDSDYDGASLDRKSTTRGCQLLRCRLILWQCKKQTVDANSTIEVEYVAASSCCGEVLWIQNQLLDYGKSTLGLRPVMMPARSAALRRARRATLSLETSSSNTSSGSSLDLAPASSSSAGPSRKRSRSSATSISSTVRTAGALSLTRADLLPPRKRYRGTSAMHSDESSDEGSVETHTESNMDSDIQADIEAVTATAATTIGDGLGIEPVIIGFETDFGPELATVETESESEDAEADDEADAEVQPEGTIEIKAVDV